MIKVKHFLDPVEPDDGKRMWIEPIGLVLELCEMCRVDHVVCHLGPPLKLWHWFAEHPEAYDYFRAQYHEHLNRGPYRPALLALVCAAHHQNLTLVHQGDDPQHNTATALYEFLSELEAYCPPET
jgi:uncharacterized protein YeaO (DUF488 family)